MGKSKGNFFFWEMEKAERDKEEGKFEKEWRKEHREINNWEDVSSEENKNLERGKRERQYRSGEEREM